MTPLAVDNYRLAIQIALEALGTRLTPIPVVASILSTPLVASALLRSGAQPLFLDVSEDLHLDHIVLQDLLKHELTETPPVILLDKAPSPELLSVVRGLPVVVAEQFPTFKQYNASSIVTNLSYTSCRYGAIIHTSHEDLHGVMKYMISGELGYYADLQGSARDLLESPEGQSQLEQLLAQHETSHKMYTEVLHEGSHDGMILHKEMTSSPSYLLKVTDAIKASVHLDSYGLPGTTLIPLHHYGEMAARWTAPPDYPVAERLADTLVSVPYRLSKSSFEEIIARIKEVD